MTPENALRAGSAGAAAVASDEDATATACLRAAAALIPAARRDLAAFFDDFYAGASPQDITRYTPKSLVDLAERVFAATTRRAEDETHVEIFAFRAQREDGPVDETVLLAVNDDRPFLFDSLIGEVSSQAAHIHALFHPILTTVRDDAGRRSTSGRNLRESVIVVALEATTDEQRKTALLRGAQEVFSQVRVAVRDWKAMQTRLAETISTLKSVPPAIASDEFAETLSFLTWLGDNHFTFLGCRDYAYDEATGRLDAIADSGLGVLSDIEARVIHRGADRGALSPDVREFLTAPSPLIITKSNERSLVHRRVVMDYVGIKIFDADGRLTGERRFVGLFTSSAYSRRPSEIPLLRLKVQRVKARAPLAPDSHDGKALAHILDTFPRDELFQATEEEVFTTAMGILRLGERPQVRVFLRFDRFDRFVSALVFVPRDRYDTHVRESIHKLLARRFNGRVSASTQILDDSMLARVHYIVGRNEGARPNVELHTLEADIRAAIRTWQDGFADALANKHGEAEGDRLAALHVLAFPPRYRDAFSPEEAVCDLDELLDLAKLKGDIGVRARAYRAARDEHGALRLKLYAIGPILPLSASLPVFENLGFRVIAEDSYTLELDLGDSKTPAAVLDFEMMRADGTAVDLDAIKQRLEDAFDAVVSDVAESDGFNRLIISANLSWRDVTILRAAAKYLRQAGITFSQDYMEDALARNPDIAGQLVELFCTRFDPALSDKNRKERQSDIEKRIDAALADVPSLDDDRIIRRLRNVIDCALRTNFFQHDENGAAKSYLSIKLDSRRLDELPAPRPLVEITVYSPQVEGVHLRFGKVARGGIRWSDRREDFRTEILGLVKAQQVKNAVIVPVGAKGGFFPKRLPLNATREAVQAAAIEAYRTFIDALLDLTDNIDHAGHVEPPDDVVRCDDDDPYLVVAADKGTATFSDIANAIAEGRGFWLGDAFASGGSHGYDHKKMGITARGAWEAVKRHFRELGRDIQTEAFTVVGVGDMSGDVFGNGMLLSKCTRLKAAFDHRHIFLDPDPDPITSYAERQRLFALQRSSWADYDTSLISPGGGVYARTVKEIVLSPQAKSLLGVTEERLSPPELIRAILKADVDLLWFGGIGTYIKASSQHNLDVGDRANDALRVNGREVRAKVIGEGANLGVTQLGRVEYALQGGRINTDAIDNSAGVDTSDHEVNLKILFSGPMRRGEVNQDERDKILLELTDEVGRHVLQDNYDQPLALSVAQARGLKDFDAYNRLMRDLERRGKLDRAVEFLPDDEGLRKRLADNQLLTRPELAVLLAYAKLDLAAEINASSLPDEPFFAAELQSYFPPQLVERFRHEMEHHRLRREIITDVLTNRIVNLAGPVFIHRLKEISGAPAARAAHAFALADGAFGLSGLKTRIGALDYKVAADIQIAAICDITDLLRRLGLWFVMNVPESADLAQSVEQYRNGVTALTGTFETLVSDFEAAATEQRISDLEAGGVPHALAEDIAVLPLLSAAPEIIHLAHTRSLSIDLVAGAYFATGEIIGLDRLRSLAGRINAGEHWDRLAIRRIVDDLYAGQRALTAKVLSDRERQGGDRAAGAAAAEAWAGLHADAVNRTRNFLAELERTGDLSIAKLTLANSQLHSLAG